VQASRSSLYLLAMNVVAVLVAWPIHHESVTLWQGAGGFVVLAAVAAVVSRPPAPSAPIKRPATIGGVVGRSPTVAPEEVAR
jgi:drug/metabolite transporter (DMT)-like permease